MNESKNKVDIREIGSQPNKQPEAGLPYELPPTYEESLTHPILPGYNAQYLAQAAAVASGISGYPQYPSTMPYYMAASYQPQYYQMQVLPGQYPKQQYPVTYAQQLPYNQMLQASQGYLQPTYYPSQQVLLQGGFDSGARPSIPPTQAGVPQNAAQLALQQQQAANMMVLPKKSNFFTGGEGAGYSFW